MGLWRALQPDSRQARSADKNGYRPALKTFDYEPMRDVAYWVIIQPGDAMLWEKVAP